LQKLDRFSVFPAVESGATQNNRAHSKPDAGYGFNKHSEKAGGSRRSRNAENCTTGITE
jgi:hypothetical protein